MVNPLHGLLGLLVGEGEPANWRGRSSLSLSLSRPSYTRKKGVNTLGIGGGEKKDASRSVGPERVGKFGNFGRVHPCIFSIGPDVVSTSVIAVGSVGKLAQSSGTG